MEKLLKLLNEYSKNKSYTFVEYNENLTGFEVLMDWKTEFLGEETVLCKRFWFIQRLVDNDKIDQTAIEWNFWYFCMEWFDNAESLIMVLSISDNPISDLISYLKTDE